MEATEPPRKGDKPPRLTVGSPWVPLGPGQPPRNPGETIEALFPEPAELPPGKVTDRAPLSWRVECSVGGEATNS